MSTQATLWMIIAFAVAIFVTRKFADKPYPGCTLDVLLTVAAAYHILPELSFRILGEEHSRYRDTLQLQYVDLWGWIVGTAFLAAAAGAVVFRRCTAPGEQGLRRCQQAEHGSLLPWAVLWGAAVAYAATGGTDATFESTNYLAGGLTRTLLPVISVMFAMKLAIRTGFIAPSLVVCAAAVATLGSRSLVAIVVLGSVSVLARLGNRISVRQLACVMIGAAALTTVLSLIRSAGLRVETFDDLDSRIEKLTTWVDAPVAQSSKESTIADFAYRLDGNSFCALVLQAQYGPQPQSPLAPEILRTSLLAITPAAVHPNKHTLRIDELDEEECVITAYNLPPDDYLPTLAGTAVAGLGAAGFLAMSFMIGILAAGFDSLAVRLKESGEILAVGLIVALLAYEQMFQGLVVSLRSSLLLAGAVAICLALNQAMSRRTSRASS